MAERLEKKPPGGLPRSVRPEETYKTPDPRPHYRELDALRGIAVLGAVSVHIVVYFRYQLGISLYVPPLGVDPTDSVLFGYLVVPLFYVLSGYLLTWTEGERERRGSYSALNYAKRRVLRIVPAYYVAIAVVLLLWPTNPSFGTAAVHLMILQGFVPLYPTGLDMTFWSFTPEIVFYAALPLLVLKFRKFSQRAAILALLFLVSLATRILMAYGFDLLPVIENDTLYINRMFFFPTTFLYLFLVGMLLRMLVERRIDAGHEPDRRQLFVASTLSVVSIAVLLAFPYLVMKFEQIVHSPASIIAEAMVILAFVSILLGSPILKPVLRWGPLVLFGTMSYSLVLLHSTVMFLVNVYILPLTFSIWLADSDRLTVWAAFVAYASSILALSAAVSYLSYRYIESPFLRQKPK